MVLSAMTLLGIKIQFNPALVQTFVCSLGCIFTPFNAKYFSTSWISNQRLFLIVDISTVNCL